MGIGQIIYKRIGAVGLILPLLLNKQLSTHDGYCGIRFGILEFIKFIFCNNQFSKENNKRNQTTFHRIFYNLVLL